MDGWMDRWMGLWMKPLFVALLNEPGDGPWRNGIANCARLCVCLKPMRWEKGDFSCLWAISSFPTKQEAFFNRRGTESPEEVAGDGSSFRPRTCCTFMDPSSSPFLWNKLILADAPFFSRFDSWCPTIERRECLTCSSQNQKRDMKNESEPNGSLGEQASPSLSRRSLVIGLVHLPSESTLIASCPQYRLEIGFGPFSRTIGLMLSF